MCDHNPDFRDPIRNSPSPIVVVRQLHLIPARNSTAAKGGSSAQFPHSNNHPPLPEKKEKGENLLIAQQIPVGSELVLHLIPPILAQTIHDPGIRLIVREPGVDDQVEIVTVEGQARVAEALGGACRGVLDAGPGDGVGGGELDAVLADAWVVEVLDGRCG